MRLMMNEDIVEVIVCDAILLDSSECTCIIMILVTLGMLFLFLGYSMKLISQKSRHLFNYLFSAQSVRELRLI